MPTGLADFVANHEMKTEYERSVRLWICHLLRYAGLAQQRVFLFPGFVNGTFRVSVRGGAVLKLDCKRGAEVSRLQALRFNPDILNARNFRRHLLHTLQSILFVGIRNARLPFEDHHVDDGFRLAKLILSCNVTAGEQHKRQQTAPKNSSRLHCANSHFFSFSPEPSLSEAPLAGNVSALPEFDCSAEFAC